MAEIFSDLQIESIEFSFLLNNEISKLNKNLNLYLVKLFQAFYQNILRIKNKNSSTSLAAFEENNTDATNKNSSDPIKQNSNIFKILSYLEKIIWANIIEKDEARKIKLPTALLLQISATVIACNKNILKIYSSLVKYFFENLNLYSSSELLEITEFFIEQQIKLGEFSYQDFANRRHKFMDFYS